MLKQLLHESISSSTDQTPAWSRVNSVLLSPSSRLDLPAPKQVVTALQKIASKNSWTLVISDGQHLSRYHSITTTKKPTIMLLEELESQVPKIGDLDGNLLSDTVHLLCTLARDTPRILLIGTTYHREMVAEEVLSRFQEEFPLQQLILEANEDATLAQKKHIALHRPSAGAWNSLGGLHDVKRQLLQHLDLTLREIPELVTTDEEVIRIPPGIRIEAAKGVVLYGRPGTGKTMLVKALAELRGVPLQSISLAELLASDVGEAERHLREAFSVEAPHILFVDELQAIFVKRSEESRSHAQMLTTQFFLLLDALPKGIMVVGATNVPSLLDESLLGGRLILLEVPPPSPSDRLLIFKSVVAKMPIAPDVDIAAVSAACPASSTGAEVHFVCRTAAMSAISANSKVIAMQHFQIAVQELMLRGGKE